jgi:hypothetical protein
MSKGDECAVTDCREEYRLSSFIDSIALVSEEGEEVRRPGRGDGGQATGVSIVAAELCHGEDERAGRVDALVRTAKVSPCSASLSDGGKEGHCTGVCTTVIQLTERP